LSHGQLGHFLGNRKSVTRTRHHGDYSLPCGDRDLREFLRNWETRKCKTSSAFTGVPTECSTPEEYQTRHRESLQTKDEAEARRLIAAKNQAATQPIFNLEMAKMYLKAHDPQFCERTWSLASDAVKHTYEGPTKARWEKFIRSEPVQGVLETKLIQTTSCHFLAVLNHPEAGVSTNVFLRILHNRALDLGWILQPVIGKKGWPKIRYGHRRDITREEHERILAVTKRQDYRDFFELL
jgi:hypothetical protein